MDHTFNPGRIRIPTGSDLGMAKEEMCNKLGLGCFSCLPGLFLITGLKNLGNLGSAACLTSPVPR